MFLRLILDIFFLFKVLMLNYIIHLLDYFRRKFVFAVSSIACAFYILIFILNYLSCTLIKIQERHIKSLLRLCLVFYLFIFYLFSL